jgi:pseudaminic acid biosynthesis-associated methylase
MNTKQLELWRSKFGNEYLERDSNRIHAEGQRRLIRDWGKMLAHAQAPAPRSALEVGCNIGRNLVALRHLVEELHGVEPNQKACEIARSLPELSEVAITEGSGFELPYEDESIDLVFTSGVLIHVAPADLGRMVDEIVRVSRRYVLCNEYFSPKPEEVNYRGLEGHLFKRDFGRFYLERHPNLRILDYGFLWKLLDAGDDSTWWLFSKQ